jgi:hypothetical protein
MISKKTNNDSSGGNLTDLPNEKYRQFFERFSEIETLDVAEWKPVHVLGYFCKKYKDTYGVPYAFKFNSPSPAKCFEVFQIKKLCMLISSNPKILKEYIDWIYQTKVVQAKRRLTSISFMTHESLTQDYKLNVLLAGDRNLNIDRSTELPTQYYEIFSNIGVFVATYGELAFLAHMSPTPRIMEAFKKLEELGFDKKILERIV